MPSARLRCSTISSWATPKRKREATVGSTTRAHCSETGSELSNDTGADSEDAGGKGGRVYRTNQGTPPFPPAATAKLIRRKKKIAAQNGPANEVARAQRFQRFKTCVSKAQTTRQDVL